jgi:glycosyltransferase involved in cell wall biosynthesis
MPDVSVIIPTHSRPRMLARAVESVRAAARDPEIIVVDDASEGGRIGEVCRALAGVKYIRLERNQRVAGARNVGLLASTCDFVSFLDDDDQRLPGSLDLQVEALKSNPEAGFCCGPLLFGDEDGRPTGQTAAPRRLADGDAFWHLLQWDYFTLPTAVVIRRDAFLQAGLLRSSLARIDDWDLWVRLAELFPVVSVAEPVGIYRRPTPASGQGSSDMIPEMLRAVRHQRELLKLPRAAAATPRERRDARRSLRRRLADVLFYRAVLWGPRGFYAYAARHALTGLRINPARALRPFVYKQLYIAVRNRHLSPHPPGIGPRPATTQ